MFCFSDRIIVLFHSSLHSLLDITPIDRNMPKKNPTKALPTIIVVSEIRALSNVELVISFLAKTVSPTVSGNSYIDCWHVD